MFSNTEIDSIIYLNSNTEDFESFVQIQAVDTEDGDVYVVGMVGVSDEWNIFHEVFSRRIDNAKVNHLMVDAFPYFAKLVFGF